MIAAHRRPYVVNQVSSLARFALNLLLLGDALADDLRILVHGQGRVLVQQAVVELLVVVHAAVAALAVVIDRNVLSDNLRPKPARAHGTW